MHCAYDATELRATIHWYTLYVCAVLVSVVARRLEFVVAITVSHSVSHNYRVVWNPMPHTSMYFDDIVMSCWCNPCACCCFVHIISSLIQSRSNPANRSSTFARSAGVSSRSVRVLLFFSLRLFFRSSRSAMRLSMASILACIFSSAACCCSRAASDAARRS